MALSGSDVKQVEERWDQIRSAIRERWPQLTRSDLKLIDGDSQKLIALVHQRTRASLGEIEDSVDEIAAQSHGLMSRVVRSVSQATSDVTDGVNRSARQVFNSVGQTVREDPARSIGAVFGAGLILGIGLYCLLGSSRSNYR